MHSTQSRPCILYRACTLDRARVEAEEQAWEWLMLEEHVQDKESRWKKRIRVSKHVGKFPYSIMRSRFSLLKSSSRLKKN